MKNLHLPWRTLAVATQPPTPTQYVLIDSTGVVVTAIRSTMGAEVADRICEAMNAVPKHPQQVKLQFRTAHTVEAWRDVGMAIDVERGGGTGDRRLVGGDYVYRLVVEDAEPRPVTHATLYSEAHQAALDAAETKAEAETLKAEVEALRTAHAALGAFTSWVFDNLGDLMSPPTASLYHQGVTAMGRIEAALVNLYGPGAHTMLKRKP